MAKKQYEFVIKVIKAKFDGGFISVSLSDMFNGNELRVEPFVGTLDEAIEQRKKVVNEVNQPSAAFLEMASRSARKPAGFDAKAKVLNFNPAAQVAS